MKTTGILMSAPMVLQTKAGAKTQTRRGLKIQPPLWANVPEKAVGDRVTFLGNHPEGTCGHPACACHRHPYASKAPAMWTVRCPYGKAGDHLVVKETWATAEAWDHIKPSDLLKTTPVYYYADKSFGDLVSPTLKEQGEVVRLRPSIFMCRWMSRITLEIVSVCVERLQDISMADVIAEGVKTEKGTGLIVGETVFNMTTNSGYMRGLAGARVAYQDLWEFINGKGSWALNPWVWVVTFKKIKG